MEQELPPHPRALCPPCLHRVAGTWALGLLLEQGELNGHPNRTVQLKFIEPQDHEMS